MPFVNMRDLAIHAREHGYAVAALDVKHLDFLEGVTWAAENCCAPVIVSLAESHFEHYDFELPMAVALARRSPSISATVPVSIPPFLASAWAATA
jgi:fructose-bisphosphate aldolase class II